MITLWAGMLIGLLIGVAGMHLYLRGLNRVSRYIRKARRGA